MLFEINENELKVVSLDGHRISIRNIELKNNYEHKKVIYYIDNELYETYNF